jgi:MerR family transcriptional regulator, light-induced transcriptional regulator
VVDAGEPALTLQETADRLCVHYMTVYRYVRLGVLTAEKSAGTWRVTPDVVEAFIQARQAGPADAPGGGRRRGRRAPWAERLEHRLVAGDARGAWGVIEAAQAAGADLDAVYLDLVAPAMVSIGRRWEAGELDVAVEHRASVIAAHLVGRLGHRFLRRGRNRGTVVLGAPAGERHGLPLALLADLLRGAGWDVSDLGPDVPAPSFALAVSRAERLTVVGVSISTRECTRSAEATIAALRDVVDGVPILAGGWAVRDGDHARDLGADGWACDGRAVVALLEDLAMGGRP